MVRVPIGEVAAKLHRTEAWVAMELDAAGIRSSSHIYSLSIDELEALVAHLRRKWERRAISVAPSSLTQASPGTDHKHFRATPPKASPLTPSEQREIALALADLPEVLRTKLRGSKQQLLMSADEIRSVSSKKSSKNSLHAQIIRFVRSSAFSELKASLEAEASVLESSRPGQRHLGVALVRQPRTPALEKNPMAVFNRLPLDWWREQE